MESRSVTPRSAHPTAPLSQVLSLFLNWKPRSFAKAAGCQAGSVGPVRIDSSRFPCFLSAVLSLALIPHYLNCKFHEHIIMPPELPGLKLTIPDRCLRGAALNLNNTIKFLECEIYPDCRSCISCTFLCEATHPQSLSTAPLSVHNEGRRLDREPQRKIIKC